jgi:hypothetical protein
MLDLKNENRIPRYELKVNGKLYQFDPFVFGWATRGLSLKLEPSEVKDGVQKALGIPIEEYTIDTFEAGHIIRDFDDFFAANIDDEVKKVFGISPVLDTTTDSVPAPSENSNPANTTV